MMGPGGWRHRFFMALNRSPVRVPDGLYYWLLDRLTDNGGWRPLPLTSVESEYRTEGGMTWVRSRTVEPAEWTEWIDPAVWTDPAPLRGAEVAEGLDAEHRMRVIAALAEVEVGIAEAADNPSVLDSVEFTNGAEWAIDALRASLAAQAQA